MSKIKITPSETETIFEYEAEAKENYLDYNFFDVEEYHFKKQIKN